MNRRGVVVAGLFAVAGIGSLGMLAWQAVSSASAVAGDTAPSAPLALEAAQPDWPVGGREWTGKAAAQHAQIIGRLEQLAFYADDSSFLDGYVHPDSLNQVAAELSSRVESVRWQLAEQPRSQTWFAAAPLAAKTIQHSPTSVTLQVWVTAVAATSDGVGVEARYWIERAELTAYDGRWVIDSLAPAQVGPNAMLPIGTSPATPPELVGLLDGFTLLDPPTGSHE